MCLYGSYIFQFVENLDLIKDFFHQKIARKKKRILKEKNNFSKSWICFSRFKIIIIN